MCIRIARQARANGRKKDPVAIIIKSILALCTYDYGNITDVTNNRDRLGMGKEEGQINSLYIHM
jgi:hypothetical protein